MIDTRLAPGAEKTSENTIEIALQDRVPVAAPAQMFRCRPEQEEFLRPRLLPGLATKRGPDGFHFYIPFFPVFQIGQPGARFTRHHTPDFAAVLLADRQRATALAIRSLSTDTPFTQPAGQLSRRDLGLRGNGVNIDE